MKRCNIFYNCENNNFLTFSNYTEALTGNFLSTDTKLFPSRFLCLNLKGLNETNKQSLVYLLTCYYENKLTVLRNYNSSNSILPLNYLLELFSRIHLVNNKWQLRNEQVKYDNAFNKDLNYEIVYISDINEQDYDGTYTDTICVINLDKIVGGIVKFTDNNVESNVTKTGDINEIMKLEGWNQDENILNNVNYLGGFPKAIYDNLDNKDFVKGETNTSSTSTTSTTSSSSTTSTTSTTSENPTGTSTEGSTTTSTTSTTSTTTWYTNTTTKNPIIPQIHYGYKFSSQINGIEFTYSNEEVNDLEFNIIIPLFDMVDINYRNNFTTIDYEYIDEVNSIPGMDLSETSNLAVKNIPLGIWINNTPIVLSRDANYAPTWSLTISSQFKPFPYSNNINMESSADSKSNAFSTFAEVLVKMNKIADSFNSLSNDIKKLNDKITFIESNLKQISTVSNVDALLNDMVEYKTDLNNQFSAFKTEITDMIQTNTWKTTI